MLALQNRDGVLALSIPGCLWETHKAWWAQL